MRNRSACYWIIGATRHDQAKAVAIDIHLPDGELECETHTISLASRAAARSTATAYAKSKGISRRNVHFDPDSTEAFANC